MKTNNHFKMVSMAIILLMSYLTSSGQATSANFGNTVQTSVDYLGWVILSTPSLAVPELTIKNEDPMSISFYTNAGNASLNNLRMWIKDDGGATTNTNGVANDGFVGIGDFSTATGTGTTPQNLLHLINAYDKPVITQWTNAGLSGHNANNGLLVGSLMSGVARLLLAELT